MKLKRFNPDNASLIRPGKCTIRFASQGQVTLSKTLVDKMNLKPGDKLELANDEESPEKRDWYLIKSDKGFSLRMYKSEKHLCFNCSAITTTLFKKYGKGKTAVGFLVASIPQVINGEQYFSILTSSAY